MGGRAPNRVRSQMSRSGRCEVELAVDQEVLLLRTRPWCRPGRRPVGAEELAGCAAPGAESASIERSSGILVSSASPVQETNAVGMHSVTLLLAPHEEGRAGRVPGGVAAGLEGGAQAAGGEAGSVGLALHQLGAGEVEDHPAAAVRRHERIVLLGGESGQGLEPVGVVRGAVLDGPVLHARRPRRRPPRDRAARRGRWCAAGCGRPPWAGAAASCCGRRRRRPKISSTAVGLGWVTLELRRIGRMSRIGRLSGDSLASRSRPNQALTPSATRGRGLSSDLSDLSD